MNQELKQQYPLLNIIEDYPDGTKIIFNQEQCHYLENVLKIYLSNAAKGIGMEEFYEFPKQLYNYLKTKENPNE